MTASEKRNGNRRGSMRPRSPNLTASTEWAEWLGEVPPPAALKAVAFRRLASLARAAEKLWRDVSMTSSDFPPGYEARAIRAAVLSMKIAHAMGLRGDLARRIVWAAYLRDIGTLAVPESILLKPGKLTRAERELIQVHPAVGFELLDAFVATEDLARIVLAHHERYDGQGYPAALQGARIPVEARVLAIAESLDAMTSLRPYREAIRRAAALKEIVDEAGRQFDPAIVEAFIRAGRV